MTLDSDNRHRNLIYGSGTVISTVLFFGILVLVALIAQRHPWRVDLTESGMFTLSDKSQKILKTIKDRVTIKAFYSSADEGREYARDLLETYRYFNPNLSYEFIDPDLNPALARQYSFRFPRTLVFEGYQRKHAVYEADEETITNGLLKLTRKEEKKVYFITGHGEPSIENFSKDGYSSVRSALVKDGYLVDKLNLMQQVRVPEDASVVVVAGPQKPLFDHELQGLKAYLEGGGKVIVFAEPEVEAGLKEFLGSYGVELHDDMVIDKLSRIYGGSYLMPMVTEYGVHPLTESFNIATIYSEARSVRPAAKPPERVHVTVLASTSPNAWAETNLELLEQGQASFEEDQDLPGPVPIAVLAQIEPEKKEVVQAETGAPDPKPRERAVELKEPKAGDDNPQRAYLLAFGDSDFVDNTHFGLSGNGDFFLNAVSYLAEEETLITIERTRFKGKPLILSPSQAWTVGLTGLGVVPALVLVSGLVVYRFRRSHR